MKRKTVLGTFVTVLLLAIFATSIHADVPRVSLDGQYVDVSPVIVDGRTLMPARDVVEMLGGEVAWNGELRQVTIEHGNTNVLLTIDNAVAHVNGLPVTLDVPPQIVNDSTKIPLRFVAEALGVDVDFYDGTILITTTATTALPPVVAPVLTPEPLPVITPEPLPIVVDELPNIYEPAVEEVYPELVYEPEPVPAIERGIISSPMQVRRNETVTLSFQGAPNAEYILRIWSAAGNELTADGLGISVANADGVVVWTWLVGGATGAGYQRVLIYSGGIQIIDDNSLIEVIVEQEDTPVVIPEPEPEPTPTPATGLVNINTASYEELQTLPGIGTTLARRIIEARPFASVDEITRIQGIGQGTLNNLRHLITV